MSYLPDTSVLIRLYDANSSQSEIVRQCIDKLESNSEELVILPQILIEFWAVATRPQNVNGLGMTPLVAAQEVEKLQTLFHLLPDNEQIFEEWKRLVVKHQVSGKVAHDARIAAALRTHKVSHLLTLNAADFKRFDNIVAVTPQEILQSAA